MTRVEDSYHPDWYPFDGRTLFCSSVFCPQTLPVVTRIDTRHLLKDSVKMLPGTETASFGQFTKGDLP